MKPVRFWPLATVIILPVLVLAAASVYGLIQRGKATRVEAAAQCRIEYVDSLWGNVWGEAVEASPRVVLYDDPPRPREKVPFPGGLLDLDDGPFPTPEQQREGESRLDKAVTEKDLAALRSLMEEKDHAPWFTASGIPIPALAAWHWIQTRLDAPASIPPADVALAVRVLTVEAPSVLTTTLLDKLSAHFPDAVAEGRRVWQLMEVRRAAFRRTSPLRYRRGNGAYGPPQVVPLPHNSLEVTGLPVDEVKNRWPGLIWTGRQRPLTFALVMPGHRGEERVLLEAELHAAARTLAEKSVPLLPPWATAGVTLKPESFIRSGIRLPEIPLGTEVGQPLTTRESSLWTVTAGAKERGAIFKDYERLVLWAAAFILTSLLTALLGLRYIRRTLHKERRLGEMKSQFVSSVSHELRAPIGSLRLMAEGLASGKVSGKAADEFHRLMAGEGARLSSLIENVLDFARIEQGRKQYHLAETDVAALVQDAVKLMQPQAEARGLKITCECAPLPFIPKVDAGAVQQALINLLDNAIKFSPANVARHSNVESGADSTLECRATIHVRLAPDAPGWSLSVTDQGGGIPEEEHARIFERFYRLGNELRRETTGTGIGLAIVKHIVEGHGGRVRVQSEMGKGSEFRMEFTQKAEG